MVWFSSTSSCQCRFETIVFTIKKNIKNEMHAYAKRGKIHRLTVHENDKWRRRFLAPYFNVIDSLRELCCVLKRENSREEERNKEENVKSHVVPLLHSF